MITKLEPNEIFVFGSNLRGIHGAGAAKQALKWGAVMHNPFGLQGQTFAIPTKDVNIETLPLYKINVYVSMFQITAKANESKLRFLVTPIGCGLAGYTPEDIAPMFKGCLELDNVVLPDEFLKVLKDERD